MCFQCLLSPLAAGLKVFSENEGRKVNVTIQSQILGNELVCYKIGKYGLSFWCKFLWQHYFNMCYEIDIFF